MNFKNMKNIMSLRDGFARAICDLGDVNNKIVVLSPDVGKSTKAIEFNKKFPERYLCTGISEQNTIGLAAGLAEVGWIPFIVGYAMFVGAKAWEPFRNSVCYTGLNVKIVATHGGINVGQDGVTHQSIEDIAIMRAIPGLTILVPCDSNEVSFLIKLSLNISGPVYIRLERESLPVITDMNSKYELGGSQELIEGCDVAIIAIGGMVWKSLRAAEMLLEKGIRAGVFNMYSVKPIDKNTIRKITGKYRCIVTAEDHNCIGGLGSAIADELVRTNPIPMEMVAVNDTFAESGTAEELFIKYHLTAKDIVRAAEKCLGRISV